MSTLAITATVWLSVNRAVEHKFPAKYQVCFGCGGNGTHVNRNIDGNGLTSEDFAEDPDFAEAYFAGNYDVRCATCGGKRVVAVIDREAAELTCPDILRAYDDQMIEEARADQEEAWLRRAESGDRW